MKTKQFPISNKETFPLSTQKGGDSSGINHQKMRFLAERGPLLNNSIIEEMLVQHHEFLSTGGAGGQWKTLQIGDLVIGFYDLEGSDKGKQAIFERMNLKGVSFQKLEFPFANLCGVFAKGTDFSFSNFSYSLLTDAVLEDGNFTRADLRYVDFSRSDLRGACFKEANLSGADFENCNLSRADFTGAKFDSARFPGADLSGVIY